MTKQLTFSEEFHYDDDHFGIAIPVTIKSGDRRLRFHAKVDTGAEVCLFRYEQAVALGLNVEQGLYADIVGTQDHLSLLASTSQEIAELVRGWDLRQWSRTYSPGKWTAAQLVLHLAHDEIGWCNRIRLALTVDNYIPQPYDGAHWVDLETPTDPDTELACYLALRRLNMILYRRISGERRAKRFPHSEWGEITIDWILRTLAGHDLHHLPQLQAIAAR